jgi:hypothetical protein
MPGSDPRTSLQEALMRRKLTFGLAAALLLAASISARAETKPRLLIFDGKATEIAKAGETSKDLWISTADLTRATKFEIKPEGICTAQLCFPIPADRKGEFIAARDGGTWFNLSEFGRLLQMPSARDTKNDVWFFGPRPEVQNSHLKSLTAPDFTLPDVDGKNHSLSDYRGKKVIIITWASW